MNKKLLTNTQIFEIKNYFSDKLCQKLNLSFVQAPLFLPANNGVND
jgi:asparagine synthetase A